MIVALAMFVISVPGAMGSMDDARFLNAISQVEGATATCVGRYGERGHWQMKPEVVREVGGYREEHARRWLSVLKERLSRAGADPTPYNLALAWNAGVTGTVRGKAPVRAYDYANRVTNIYGTRY